MEKSFVRTLPVSLEPDEVQGEQGDVFGGSDTPLELLRSTPEKVKMKNVVCLRNLRIL